MNYVIRIDIEVKGNNDDAIGEKVNHLVTEARKVGAKHFRWAFVEAEGLNDPNLEKDLALGLYQ